MKTAYCSWFISLGLVLCAGCGDNSAQSWENGKPQSSAGKSGSKPADVANNDSPSDDSRGDKSNGPQDVVAGNDGKLDVDSVHWTVPKSWVRKQPNAVLKAEYAIPHAEGDTEDGRVTVSQVGNTIESNLARWKKQFRNKPSKQNQESIGPAKVTVLELAGTFDDPGNMMSAPVTRPGYRMIGAAVEVPNEQLPFYIKCYGPEKTIAAHADEIKGFIRSMKVDK
jgi:hypothetical protein